MSKPLIRYSGKALKDAIARRLKSKTGGLGYWSAVAAQAHIDRAEAKKKAEEAEEVQEEEGAEVSA